MHYANPFHVHRVYPKPKYLDQVIEEREVQGSSEYESSSNQKSNYTYDNMFGKLRSEKQSIKNSEIKPNNKSLKNSENKSGWQSDYMSDMKSEMKSLKVLVSDKKSDKKSVKSRTQNT